MPVSAVRAAAAQSTGLHYYDEAPEGQGHAGDQERDLLIASIDELSPDDRRHVAALVQSLRNKAAGRIHKVVFTCALGPRRLRRLGSKERTGKKRA